MTKKPKTSTLDGTLHTCSFCGKKTMFPEWDGFNSGRFWEICSDCYYNNKLSRKVTGYNPLLKLLGCLCIAILELVGVGAAFYFLLKVVLE